MRNLPTPQQLRYFLAVADELNFGRAARRCHVSQSTISGAVNDLESAFNARLLERNKRHVALTREGTAMAVHARDILNRLEDIADLAHSLRGPLAGGLRLGIIPTIAPFLLPDLFARLKRDYPALQAQVNEDLTPVLLEKIHSGTIDCAILALPYPLGDLAKCELFSDRLMVAHTKPQKLEQSSRGISSAVLRQSELLLLNDGHCLKDQALAACKLSPAEISITFQAASLMTLIGMVSKGLGVTFVPEIAVPAFRKCHPRVTYSPLAEARAHRQIVICWRKTSHREADFRIIADLIEKLHKG